MFHAIHLLFHDYNCTKKLLIIFCLFAHHHVLLFYFIYINININKEKQKNESRKQADSSEACRQAKDCLL